MKSTAWIALLAAGLLVPLACTRPISSGPVTFRTPTPSPTGTPTPTFTPTLAPGCGFTPVVVDTPGIPAPTPQIFPQIPTGTVTPLPTSTPGPFFPGTPMVIRDQTDWEDYFGVTPAPAPPVDLSVYDLLVDLQVSNPFAGGVYGVTVTDVCWDTSAITVTCDLIYPCPPPGLPVPVSYYAATAVAVPKSNLPVLWRVGNALYPLCPPPCNNCGIYYPQD